MLYILYFVLYHISSLLKTIAPNLAIFFFTETISILSKEIVCAFFRKKMCALQKVHGILMLSSHYEGKIDTIVN